MDALVSARRRGASIEALLDKRQAVGSSTKDMRARAAQLSAAGVGVRVRSGKPWSPGATFGRGMMHCKGLRVGEVAIVGSANHTRNSTAECCELCVQVALTPAGVAAFQARFAEDYAAACPLAEVPSAAPTRPRKGRAGSASS